MIDHLSRAGREHYAARRESFKQCRNTLRLEQVVVAQELDVLTACCGDTGAKVSCQAYVFGLSYEADSAIRAGRLAYHGFRAIARMIIDNEDFQIGIRLRLSRGDRVA